MKIILNGEDKNFENQSLTVLEMLNTLELPLEHIAVEINRNIIPKSQFFKTQLVEGDKIEIVRFVGGGLR
ncbi:MAG: sulfur carrier protein ThiS [Spirochaetota bacterium]|nr:sulfur carrier protein ThiS [Spirochaetota bacterium]